MRNTLRSLRLSLELLVGRRFVLFATVDILAVGIGLLKMLLESEARPAEVYTYVFLFPALILALPAMAGMVDLERQAGCLDLALSAPSAEAYFVRRAAAVCLLAALQGGVIMLACWLYFGFSFPILAALLQIALTSAFLGAVTLFWAVRLRTAGAVWLASTVTVGLMWKWFFFNPTAQAFGTVPNPFVPNQAEVVLPWLASLAVLAGGSALFFLYARRRLRRPELMIS